ncbi:hypothetical protein Q4R49_19775 [Morganella morganii subsp. sibonii]
MSEIIEFLEKMRPYWPHALKAVGLLILAYLAIRYSSKVYRFLVNSSPKKELVRYLIKERMDIESSVISHECNYTEFSLSDNYKAYKYKKLLPDALCELTVKESTIILELWDDLKNAKIKRLSNDVKINAIDKIISRLTR